MARKLFLVIAAVLSGSVFGAWDRHLLLPGYSPLMDQPKPHDLAYFKNSHCVERGHMDHMPGCPPAKTEA